MLDLERWTAQGAVLVHKPHDISFQEAEDILDSKRHILIEGISAFSCAQVLRLADKAFNNQVTFLESLCLTSNPWIDVLKREMLSLGQIERVLFLSCVRLAGCECEAADTDSLYRVDFSRGALRERGAACIYPVLKCFGQPDALLPSPVFCENGIDIAGSVLAWYEHMRVEILYSVVSGSHMPSRIQGQNGGLIIKDIAEEPRIIVCDGQGAVSAEKALRIYDENDVWAETATEDWRGCMSDPVRYASRVKDMRMLHETLDRMISQSAPILTKDS